MSQSNLPPSRDSERPDLEPDDSDTPLHDSARDEASDAQMEAGQASLPETDAEEAPTPTRRPGAAAFPEPRQNVGTYFQPRTQRGETARSVLRTFLLAVFFFALGALLVYFLLYQPMQQQFDTLRTEREQLASLAQDREQSLTKAEQENKAIRAQAQQVQDRLDHELARVSVLQAQAGVATARFHLVQQDAQAAVQSLDQAQSDLRDVQPTLEKLDAQQTSTLAALFTLAKNDMGRDLSVASNRETVLQDLERLQNELNRAEENVLAAPAGK